MTVRFASFHTDPHVDRSIIDGELFMTLSEEDADAWRAFTGARSTPLSLSVSDDGRVLHIRSGEDTDVDDVFGTVSDSIDSLEAVMDGQADPDTIGDALRSLRISIWKLASVMGIDMGGDA